MRFLFMRCVQPIDEFALVIALRERERHVRKGLPEALLQRGQRLRAVRVWLARAEQVEVWTV
jgi:hypothetical protein